jgi:hypothetical protein
MAVVRWADTVVGVSDQDAAERRSQLTGLKLRALVRDHVGADAVGAPAAFAPGAALLHGDAAWVLVDERPEVRLGAALAWALRAGAASLNVLADRDTGVLARRAGEFTFPISVWHVDERTLLPAVPMPLEHPPPVPVRHEELRARIIEGGAQPIAEHGVLSGEVCGLEVCRVVDDAHTGNTRLEVGVGAHDREAFQMLHGDVPTVESLTRVAEAVATHRVPGAPQHPLNRLAAERLLRWRIEQQPGVVGARSIAPMQPPVPRVNVKDPIPCAAIGEGVDGETVVAVCASGVDLDVVPYAADARLAAGGTASPDVGIRLVVVMPTRDRLPVIEELAGLLREPVEFVGLD